MAQTDYNILNSSGAVFRQRVNEVNAAVKSINSGASAPSDPVAGMLWFDTSVSPAVLRQRNAANSAWVAIATQGYVDAAARGYIFGLTLANNTTDANNDIDIAAGTAASDDASPVLMTLSSTLTKRLDAAWAVGTGNGGLDTGSKANSTWYYVWLIRRPDTGVVDALFSASSTAPTMPADYTQKRLVGFVLTNGSGNLRAFTQRGDDYIWGELLSAQLTLTSTDLFTPSLAVPPIARAPARAYISGNVLNLSSGFSMWLGDGSGVNVAAGVGTSLRVDVADIAAATYAGFQKSVLASSGGGFSARTNFAGVVLTYSTNSFSVDRRLL